jgi:HlyD family secretion protein
MKRTLRIIATIGVLAVIAAVTIGAVQTGSGGVPVIDQQFLDENNIIDETIVSTGSLLVTVSATGTIEPVREAPLGFQTSGVVTEVLVEEGDFVRQGDVLARLDMSDLETQYRLTEIDLRREQVSYEDLVAPARDVDLAAQQAALNAARASAGAAYDSAASENDIEIARLEAELADNQRWQAQIQRDQQMALGPEFRDSGMQDSNAQEVQLANSIESQQYQLEIARTTLTDTINTGPDLSRLGQATADIVEAQVALEDLMNGPDEIDRRIAEASLELAELSLQQVGIELENGVIVAPFDGIVAENNLTVGELPPQGSAITLIDTSELIIDLPVDEDDISNVEVGQNVELELDALREAGITGTVTRVNVTPTQSGAVVTYTVRVRVNPTDEPLRVGMTTTAEVVVAERDDVILLPNRFIRRDSDTNRSFVTILDPDGNLTEVVVELGERNETESEILSGLEDGDRVVLIQRETGVLDQ